jgi:hypothetical protein
VSPPQAPQKGTTQKTASGDRNPKNVVLQGGFVWFSQTINVEGRAAVQWHQLALDGTIVQTGLIRGSATNYIQTSIAVNKSRDVLIGFQETHADMFISPRMAYRFADDPLGTIREIVGLEKARARRTAHPGATTAAVPSTATTSRTSGRSRASRASRARAGP